MLRVKPGGVLERFVAFLVGLAMISLGVTPYLRNGNVLYTNWFGDLVFTPVAVLAGIFTIYCAVFKPEWLAANRMKGRRSKKA
jgi:uncharacterized membrane protein